MNQKQAISAMQDAFCEADEAGATLEQCWEAAYDALVAAGIINQPTGA